MGALTKLLGFILIIFAGYNLFIIFQAQIFSEVAQSQTPEFLDFIFESTTPDVTANDIRNGVIYGIVFIVGLVLLIR